MQKYLFAVFLSFTFTQTVLAESQKPLIPVVFAHGIFLRANAYKYLFSVKYLFKKNGYKFLVADTPRTGTLEERAKVLKSEVHRLVPTGPLHIVAQSIGGLDSRYAISKLGLGDRVLSLTTIATPHHGSRVADYAMSLMESHLGTGDNVDKILQLFKSSIDSTENLTSKFLTEDFNVNVRNDERVRYYSMGFKIKGNPALRSTVSLLWWGHKINSDQGDRENDGLVSPNSAKWGEYLGTFEGDHAAQTLPFLYAGKFIHHKVFKKVIENLEAKFN